MRRLLRAGLLLLTVSGSYRQRMMLKGIIKDEHSEEQEQGICCLSKSSLNINTL